MNIMKIDEEKKRLHTKIRYLNDSEIIVILNNSPASEHVAERAYIHVMIIANVLIQLASWLKNHEIFSLN
jgi:hypothetical protein